MVMDTAWRRSRKHSLRCLLCKAGNPNMLRYAAAEIESTDMVKSLTETSRQLNKHLLVYNDKTAKNVVKLK